MRARFILYTALGVLLAVGARAGELAPAKLQEMEAAITRAIAEGKTPGAVLWVEHGTNSYTKAFGQRALVPTPEAMTADTIFDIASLTKVIATTPAIMLLVERGQVKLDSTVQSYLPEFNGTGKAAITIRQLLTHTSGLPEDISFSNHWHGAAAAIALASAIPMKSLPGGTFRYSDINYFLLGEIVHRVSGTPLNEFCAREIYGPLHMVDTCFLPSADKIARIAPTQMTDGVMLRGLVHDPTARAMGGVAGHAGVFTTAADLARYARMMLNAGTLDGVRIFQPETVKLMTSVQTPPSLTAKRGLGWDIDSPYSGPRGEHFPLGSYGHTGFTGIALWIDPSSTTFFIFLSNRVHPNGQGSVVALYRSLGTLAAEAVTDFNFKPGPPPSSPHPAP